MAADGSLVVWGLAVLPGASREKQGACAQLTIIAYQLHRQAVFGHLPTKDAHRQVTIGIVEEGDAIAIDGKGAQRTPAGGRMDDAEHASVEL